MTTLYVNGDSFSNGYGSSSPSTLGYVPIVADYFGYSVSNAAVDGSEVADQAGPIMTRTPSSDKSVFFIGMNDQRHFGTNATNIACFGSATLGLGLWLSVNNADVIRADSGTPTYSGTWGTSAEYGGLPRWSDTSGSYVEFTLTGNSLYICTIQQTGSTGQEQISIDGVSQGTFNVAPASSIITYSSIAYMPKCYNFNVGGAITDTHTIRITKANGTALGSRMYFLFGWGNGMKNTTPYPSLYLAGPTICTPAGYSATGIGSFSSTLAYNNAMRQTAQTLADDGLDVKFVETFWELSPSAQTNGGAHPNDDGYFRLAQSFAGVMA
jgi:hypothetical protein